MGLLEGAPARPENLLADGDREVADLACRPCVPPGEESSGLDGDKRASPAACTTVLLMDGSRLPIGGAENIATWQAPAGGDLDETDTADRLRARVVA